MNIGDRVWVQVSRNKERPGEIHTIEKEDAYVIIDDVDTIDYYPLTAIRPIGERTEDTEPLHIAKKNDQEKNRMELIPVTGLEGIGRAMTFGAKKYSAHNWANGFDWLRLVGSCLRHITAWSRGEDKDPESGLSHLDHAGACIVMLIAHETEELGNDDRRKTKN